MTPTVAHQPAHPSPVVCPDSAELRRPGPSHRVADIALRLAASLELSEVLERVAEEAAALFGCVCQVRFAPPGRPADGRRAVAGPGGAGGPCDVAETYAALLALLGGPEPGRADGPGLHSPRRSARREASPAPPGAALLLAPLVARGRRIGTVDLVLPAPDDADVSAERRLLQELAAHAALAIDSADQIARLRERAAPAAGPAHAADPGPVLALLARELRGPLAALGSAVRLLARMAGSGQELDLARAARLAEGAVAAIADLEAQLAALTPRRTAAPSGPPAPARPVDLVALARLLANFYQQTTGRHRLSVDAAVPELPGPWPRPHLERALGNLIAGGVAWSPGGEVRISVGRDEDDTGCWATLSVECDGAACDPAGQARPRARGAPASIGLASTREALEQCGGVLTIQSAVGGLTTLQARLPLAWGGGA